MSVRQQADGWFIGRQRLSLRLCAFVGQKGECMVFWNVTAHLAAAYWDPCLRVRELLGVGGVLLYRRRSSFDTSAVSCNGMLSLCMCVHVKLKRWGWKRHSNREGIDRQKPCHVVVDDYRLEKREEYALYRNQRVGRTRVSWRREPVVSGLFWNLSRSLLELEKVGGVEREKKRRK